MDRWSIIPKIILLSVIAHTKLTYSQVTDNFPFRIRGGAQMTKFNLTYCHRLYPGNEPTTFDILNLEHGHKQIEIMQCNC